MIGGHFDGVVGPTNKSLGVVVGPKRDDYGIEIWMETVVERDGELYRQIEAFLRKPELAHDRMVAFSFGRHNV
jgi:hypothetical protein